MALGDCNNRNRQPRHRAALSFPPLSFSKKERCRLAQRKTCFKDKKIIVYAKKTERFFCAHLSRAQIGSCPKKRKLFQDKCNNCVLNVGFGSALRFFSGLRFFLVFFFVWGFLVFVFGECLFSWCVPVATR